MTTPLEFIKNVYSAAQTVQCQSGMFASVTIAQAFLETGFGQHMPVDVHTGELSYNIFGIKAAANEPYVVSLTREVYKTLPSEYVRYNKLPNGKYEVFIYANFRKFKNYTECFLGRSAAFMKSKYWKKAIAAATPEEAVYALQHTGYFDDDGTEIAYATDPHYVESITRIINQYNLKQYDLTKEDIQMIADLEKRIEALEKLVAQQNTKVPEQTVSPWAKEGYQFVTAKKGDLSISDGTRPKDPVTREELWTSLQRANTIYNTK